MLLLAAGASVASEGSGEVIADGSIFLEVCGVFSNARSSTSVKTLHGTAWSGRGCSNSIARSLFAPARMTIRMPTNFETLVRVNRMYNSTKDVGIRVNNTLRVALACLVKLKENAKTRGRNGAKNKNPPVGDPVV